MASMMIYREKEMIRVSDRLTVTETLSDVQASSRPAVIGRSGRSVCVVCLIWLTLLTVSKHTHTACWRTEACKRTTSNLYLSMNMI